MNAQLPAGGVERYFVALLAVDMNKTDASDCRPHPVCP
jgi:hypothetical protein